MTGPITQNSSWGDAQNFFRKARLAQQYTRMAGSRRRQPHDRIGPGKTDRMGQFSVTGELNSLAAIAWTKRPHVHETSEC